MQSISIGFGKTSFSRSSVSLSAHAVEAPFARQFPSKVYSRRGKLQSFPASQYPDINGTMYLDTLEIPNDGGIIMLQNSHRMRGSPIRDGAVWLRLREQGPALTVTAILMPSHESLLGERFLCFQGRADLISLEDAAESGIQPGPSWVDGFMQEDEIAACFEIHELSPELSPKPKLERVRTMSGGEVTLTVSQPGRRIRVK